MSPSEVEEAIYTRPRWIDFGRNDTQLIYATTAAGRHLFVVLTTAMDGRDFVVTAREMTASEKRTVREKGH